LNNTFSKKNENPIGIFDSGVGGLTVYKEIRKLLPNEDIIYLGDTARVPYGTKSIDVVKKYSKQNVEFLLSHNVKTVVVACNTASAASTEYLKEMFNEILIIDVIDPVIKYIKQNLQVFKIGIIGTATTIQSNAYQKSLKNMMPSVDILSKPCPLFVPLVEEGLFEGPITDSIIEMYLSEMKHEGIQTVILGCTHYPMMKKSLQKYFGNSVTILDTAIYTAIKLSELLRKHDLVSPARKGRDSFFVTDSAFSFKKTAEMFLGFKIQDIFHI